MSTVPSDPRQLITFCTAHKETWVTNQALIGVSASQNTALSDALMEASKALDSANAARAASKGATTTLLATSAKLRTAAADLVRTVQTFAKNNDNPAVYGLADIPAPKPRSQTAPPPGQPGDIRATVNSNGSLTLNWKSNNPSGVSNVVYKIQRSLNGDQNFTLLDTTGGGERTFTDSTIPMGTTSVSYIITGKRGKQVGPMSETFTARFGTTGGGGMFLASTSTSPSVGVKLAA
jgi:hypothetical protein